jgi:CheY-like chemotaxis protein
MGNVHWRRPAASTDWVLMDIKLGGMDGFATARAIRRSDPRARIIIITSMARRSIAARHAPSARAASCSGQPPGATGIVGVCAERASLCIAMHNNRWTSMTVCPPDRLRVSAACALHVPPEALAQGGHLPAFVSPRPGCPRRRTTISWPT